jgi:hypothetical protein
MASAKVSVLTKQDIASAARRLKWTRQLPKWTVVVEGRELPARPLVLEAAGVPPNDPTNSHQAVAILQDRGFDVRYQGEAIQSEGNHRGRRQFVSDEFIHNLRGCGKGDGSLVAAREREHRIEDDRAAK